MRKSEHGRNRPSDTLVISPYPLGGNAANTGPRYDEEARITGMHIEGLTRTGSDTLHPSLRLKRTLSDLKLFDELCAEQAAGLKSKTEYYDKVIVRGQSTGGFPALGMVRSGAMRVTHLLLEDGINTRVRSDGAPLSDIQARREWLNYDKSEKAGMPRPPHEGWVAPPRLDLTPLEQAQATGKFIIETMHLSTLWRSAYGRDAALEIAGDQPNLPMLFKFLGHSGTTTPEGVEAFQEQLKPFKDLRASTEPAGASIITDYNPDAWHGFLVYPQYRAANLQQIAGMESLVV